MRVSGVVRRSERPSSFVPPNDPPSGAWYWVDAQAMARAQQLPPSTPLVEAVGQAGEGAPAGAYPQPSVEAALLRFPTTPGDHANYAATWLTLSAAIGGLAGRAIRARARSLR